MRRVRSFSNEDGDGCGDGERTSQVGHNFIMYDSFHQIEECFKMMLPISCVATSDRFFCVMKDETLLQIKLRAHRLDYFGHSYFRVSKPRQTNIQESDSISPEHFCVLLPFPAVLAEQADVKGETLYAVITSDWLDLLSDKSFGYPQLPDAIYNN